MDNTDYLSLPFLVGVSEKRELSRTHLTGIGILMAFLGLLAGFVIAKRLNLRDGLAANVREAAAGPYVQTAQTVLSGQDRILKEVGETLPYATATLYAKVSGYLGNILVDKGDKVRKGQLLAAIVSPETSSQYSSALADVKEKKLIAERARALFGGGDVTAEERDRAVAAADMAAAKVEELGARKDYATITAPFDGTVTARFADPGALVQNAARAESGALPVVTVSQTDRLRVTMYINQSDSPLVRVGDPALIVLTERPGVSYRARVTRKAGELDLRSRTMLTEIELDNPNDEIVPGAFVDITLRVKAPQTIQIPSQALVMRGTSAYVAVVAKNSVVHYRKVEAGSNDGAMVSVLKGLERNETVVLNAGNSLTDGQHIQVENGQ